MPQVNLSTLNGAELRDLLDASRRHGDAQASYRILQEMAARREGPLKTRREPRFVAIDLGDPLEKGDDLPPMPNWRPPGLSPNSPPSEIDRPLSLQDPGPPPPPQAADSDPADIDDLRLHPVGRESPPARRRAPLQLVAGFALGITLGAGLGWWAAGREAVSAPVPVQTAALAPAPAPPAPSLAAPAAPPEPAAEPAAPEAAPNALDVVRDAGAIEPPATPRAAPTGQT
ncbi:MAG: hypothetical protein ABI655_01980, partial [Phenylobacterium sp.]